MHLIFINEERNESHFFFWMTTSTFHFLNIRITAAFRGRFTALVFGDLHMKRIGGDFELSYLCGASGGNIMCCHRLIFCCLRSVLGGLTTGRKLDVGYYAGSIAICFAWDHLQEVAQIVWSLYEIYYGNTIWMHYKEQFMIQRRRQSEWEIDDCYSSLLILPIAKTVLH